MHQCKNFFNILPYSHELVNWKMNAVDFQRTFLSVSVRVTYSILTQRHIWNNLTISEKIRFFNLFGPTYGVLCKIIYFILSKNKKYIFRKQSPSKCKRHGPNERVIANLCENTKRMKYWKNIQIRGDVSKIFVVLSVVVVLHYKIFLWTIF